MKTAGPLEKVIERKLVEYVKSKGGHTRKWSSPSNSGVPDRIIAMPGGAVGFLELKRLGNVPTKKQHHEMALLKQMGATVRWVDNYQDACFFVDELILIGRRSPIEKAIVANAKKQRERKKEKEWWA